MASSKAYLDFILDQLSGLDEISCRAMMGEYILYYHAYGLYQFPRNSLPAEHYMFFPLHTLLLVCLNYSSFKIASDCLLSMHAPRSARIIIEGIAKAF